MAKWTFEPGHTAAEFTVRHMMVTDVRGHFKNVRGSLEFDPESLETCAVEIVIDTRELWTGEPDRDAHLKSADFLDVERHPQIRFHGGQVKLLGQNEGQLSGDLTIRGITRPVTLAIRYLGQWRTPWWEGGVDRGPRTRAGFVATTQINRHDFGVSWNAELEKRGVVVGNEVQIVIDAEAVRDADT